MLVLSLVILRGRDLFEVTPVSLKSATKNDTLPRATIAPRRGYGHLASSQPPQPSIPTQQRFGVRIGYAHQPDGAVPFGTPVY
jgi:hypothetical protein